MDTDAVMFDPNKHCNDSCKAFKAFCTRFELRYNAQYPDPPPSAMESSVQRWRILNPPTEENPRPNITIDQYDELKAAWKSQDMVRKALGMFSSEQLFSDWEIAQPDPNVRSNATWEAFKTTMETFYAPSDNPTLKNFQFRDLKQKDGESFPTFCIRVEKEAKSCSFKCAHGDCTAEQTAVRDQILIGTVNNKIREEALLKAWDLGTLRTEGTKLESALRGEAEIAGGVVNKVSKYSFSSLKNKQKSNTSNSGLNCYNCGEMFFGPAYRHKQTCKASSYQCKSCKRMGHFEKYCRNSRSVNQTNITREDEDVNSLSDVQNSFYNVNIFKVSANDDKHSNIWSLNKASDFNVEVVVNGSIASITADTGAKVSVCGKVQADRWGLLKKITPTSVRIKPYNSTPVPAIGMARCSVTFGTTSIPVCWYILDGSCEPILSGSSAVNLGIIQFTKTPPIYKPINMINTKLPNCEKDEYQNILTKFNGNFRTTLGKHNNYTVKIHVDPDIKPVITPQRPTPYHLKERVSKALQNMIDNDVIEEHPVGDPTPWVSNVVPVPKPDGSIRITLDARNINKAIISSNLPIPRQEDIMTKLAGSKIFSKLDFRNAFWQLPLDEASRALTVFHLNDKLYRYKRLIMGIKCAQGELNAALIPVFSHIPDAHVIHDDVIVASKNSENHLKALEQCMLAVEKADLTLNEEKCWFGYDEVKFWGMKINTEYIQPDDEKVEALDYLEPRKIRMSFIAFCV